MGGAYAARHRTLREPPYPSPLGAPGHTVVLSASLLYSKSRSKASIGLPSVANIRSVRSNSRVICPLMKKRLERLGYGTDPGVLRRRDRADEETSRRAVEGDGEKDYRNGIQGVLAIG